MVSFILSILALILGYLVYGRFVEVIYGADASKTTPAAALNDGVDFVPINKNRAFLIQFLNIAGLGPIFGAVAGACWGPVSFLWIVFGCIFAGATHDYFSGMLSMRHEGETVAELVGRYLGTTAKNVMRVFSVILLVLVGVIFVTGPAAILESMTNLSRFIWITVIIIYYLCATVIPIDKIIGKIYPLFGAALIIMGIGIILGIFVQGYKIPEIQLVNMHPEGRAIFPYLFITIACGAISGFHATQSPIIARCISNEKEGRFVFYGAMIAEGILALIWAAAAMTFFGSTEALMNAGPAALVVKTISVSLLGTAGSILALFGVVACPITSGDTAFRSARLTIADAINFKQRKIKNRFLIAIPLFAIGISLCFIDFSIIWRYFAWSNQTLATIMLWTAAAFLIKVNKTHYIVSIPAAFMTSVVTSYILMAPEGLGISSTIGYPIGILTGIILFIWLLVFASKHKKTQVVDKIN